MLKTAEDLLFLSAFFFFPAETPERSCRSGRCTRLRWERRVNVGKDGGMRRKEEKQSKNKSTLLQRFSGRERLPPRLITRSSGEEASRLRGVSGVSGHANLGGQASYPETVKAGTFGSASHLCRPLGVIYAAFHTVGPLTDASANYRGSRNRDSGAAPVDPSVLPDN